MSKSKGSTATPAAPEASDPIRRIYLVRDTTTGDFRLIRAGNQAQAIRFVAGDRFDGRLASQDDLIGAITAGVKVEEATDRKQLGLLLAEEGENLTDPAH